MQEYGRIYTAKQSLKKVLLSHVHERYDLKISKVDIEHICTTCYTIFDVRFDLHLK